MQAKRNNTHRPWRRALLWLAGLLFAVNIALWLALIMRHGNAADVVMTDAICRKIEAYEKYAGPDLFHHLPPDRQKEVLERMNEAGTNREALRRYLDGLVSACACATQSREEIEAEMAPMREQFPTEQAFLRELALSGLTERQLATRLAMRRIDLQAFDENAAALARIDPQEIVKFYEKNPGLFQLPRLHRARHIFLIAPESGTEPALIEAQKRKIQAAADRLEAGEDFAALARELSEDPATREQGGLLPLFSMAQLPGEFAKQVRTLEPGESSSPFYEPELGWHILRLEEIRPARRISLEEARPFIRRELMNRRRKQVVERLPAISDQRAP